MRLIDADEIKYEVHEKLGLGIDYSTNESDVFYVAYKHQIDSIPTIDHAYGFPLEHLALIARVMEKEGVTPGEVAGLLRYACKISGMVVDVMQKAYTKSTREAVRRIDDDPSHPFADGVMMKE